MNKKYIDIKGVVELPDKYSFNQAIDDFLKYLRNRDCTFGGGFVEIDENGNEIDNL